MKDYRRKPKFDFETGLLYFPEKIEMTPNTGIPQAENPLIFDYGENPNPKDIPKADFSKKPSGFEHQKKLIHGC